jgi:hypothetical protein
MSTRGLSRKAAIGTGFFLSLWMRPELLIAQSAPRFDMSLKYSVRYVTATSLGGAQGRQMFAGDSQSISDSLYLKSAAGRLFAEMGTATRYNRGYVYKPNATVICNSRNFGNVPSTPQHSTSLGQRVVTTFGPCRATSRLGSNSIFLRLNWSSTTSTSHTVTTTWTRTWEIQYEISQGNL